jgi:hypothetical protein
LWLWKKCTTHYPQGCQKHEISCASPWVNSEVNSSMFFIQNWWFGKKAKEKPFIKKSQT